MNPKKIIIVSTMAIAITISAGMFGNDVNAQTITIITGKLDHQDKPKEIQKTVETIDQIEEDVTQILGLSEEELYDALYQGNSIADLAERNQIPLQKLVNVQVNELSKQLDSRLANGSITHDTYLLQKLELPDIVTKSILTRINR